MRRAWTTRVHLSADDVVQAAKSSGVLVYSIGIGNPNSPAGMSIATGPFAIGGDEKEHVDAVTLSRLASANGSKSYIVQKVENGADLKACDEISEDCTNGTRRAVDQLIAVIRLGGYGREIARVAQQLVPLLVHLQLRVSRGEVRDGDVTRPLVLVVAIEFLTEQGQLIGHWSARHHCA